MTVRHFDEVAQKASIGFWGVARRPVAGQLAFVNAR